MTEQSLEERKLAVIEQITKAFDGVSRGDGITLYEAEVIDNCGDEKERQEARKLDTETRWQDVPDKSLACGGNGCMSFLDSEGYRYYLPAFMIWSLRNTMSGPERDNITHEEIVRTLGSMSYGKKYFEPCKYRKYFTLKQKQSIAAFLEFLMMWYHFDVPSSYDNYLDEEQKCLDNYWGQFLEGA